VKRFFATKERISFGVGVCRTERVDVCGTPGAMVHECLPPAVWLGPDGQAEIQQHCAISQQQPTKSIPIIAFPSTTRVTKIKLGRGVSIGATGMAPTSPN